MSLTKIKLVKGDQVVVRVGKDKGKIGRVLATHRHSNKVTVEGINIVKHHKKPSRAHPQGGIIELTQPIPVAKVGLYKPDTKTTHRVAYQLKADGQKLRVYSGTDQAVKLRASKSKTKDKQ